jgi:predicted RNA polymerase sigma factor
MSEFTYLYRGREVSPSPEQMQKTTEKWMAWFKQLGENGHIKDPGHPLEHTGKVVKGKHKAVIDALGNLSSLVDQDRSQWDRNSLLEGMQFLELSAAGAALSEYHVEAAIAAVHARAARLEDTEWKAIVNLYDTLMTIRPSPIVALNRAIAIAQDEGPDRGLDEILSIADRERLCTYPFYFAALGELELRRRNRDTARENFLAALALARNPMERRFIDQRVAACN